MSGKVNTESSVSLLDTQRLGRVTVQGISWTLASSSFAKAASFLSQITLGWLLSPSDFGVYALAISAAALVDGLRNGGTDRILVQRGKEYDELASPIFKIALLFNLLAMSTLMLCAPLAAQAFNTPDLPPLIVIIALALPLTTPVAVLRAKLTIDLRFKNISEVDSLSALIRACSVVVFALLGFGPLSFVLPLFIVAIYEGVAFARHARLWPRTQTPARSIAGGILRDARWVIIASFGLAMCLRGTFFAVGLLEEHSLVGVYFFGSQLSMSFLDLLAPGIAAVMLSTFSKVSQQPQLQARGYLKSIRMLCLITIPACVVLAIMAEPIIRILWFGKWDAAIPVVQVLVLFLPAALLSIVSLALVEARGRWALRAILIYIHAIAMIICAVIGAWMGGLIAIALWFCGFQIAISLLHSCVAARLVSLSFGSVVSAIWPSVGFAIFSALLSHYAAEILVSDGNYLFGTIFQACFFILTFWALAWSALRIHYKEIISVLMPHKAPPPTL